MAPIRRKCIFNEDLAREYPFLEKRNHKGDIVSGVYCKKCMTTFSIANGGRSQITHHLNTKTHQAADRASIQSQPVTDFFPARLASHQELQLAAQEGAFSFHIVQHDQSFRSMDCTSKLIKMCFEKKFACARTKSEAIAVSVLSPSALNQLKVDLSDAKFITVLVDCSNHESTKLFPIMVRYFLPTRGIQLKLLELHTLPGETAETLHKHLLKSLQKFKIEDKIIALCADNTNTNFGGLLRRGKENLFCKLKSSLQRDILGIGCVAHIINNALETAADQLPVDVETMVYKIYKHFYIYTVRTETLKEFCEFVDIEYRKLLSSSRTRWLSLSPALDRILKLYEGLKSYFLSTEDTPLPIKRFFECRHSEIICLFLQSQSYCFHQTVLKVEGEDKTATEILRAIDDLTNALKLRKEEKFIGIQTRNSLRKLIDEGDITETEFYFWIDRFYTKSISYLVNWTKPMEAIRNLSWIMLKSIPTWADIEQNLNIIKEKSPSVGNVEDRTFTEFGHLKAYVTDDKIAKWTAEGAHAGERWKEIFTLCSQNDVNIECFTVLVQYALTLPGTSASVERIFSLINNYWSSEKTQLKVETLQSILMLKCNVKMTCSEYYVWLSSQTDMLKAIHSSNKYD